MELDEAREILAGKRPASEQEAWTAGAVVLLHLAGIESRAQQILGGLKPHDRPHEVAAFILGRTPDPDRPRPPAHID